MGRGWVSQRQLRVCRVVCPSVLRRAAFSLAACAVSAGAVGVSGAATATGASATTSTVAVSTPSSSACSSAALSGSAGNGSTTSAPPATQTEIPSKDTPTSTTYEEPDGSFKVTMKATPYQYRDSCGNWQPIDSTLVADNHPGEAYQTKGASVIAELPATAGGPLMVHEP
jgi:hypothetical protein